MSSRLRRIMKTRNGFVSNSSASCFIIFGILVDSKEMMKIMKDNGVSMEENGCSHKFDRSKIKFCPKCGEDAYIEIEFDEAVYDFVRKEMKLDVEFYGEYGEDYDCYIGRLMDGDGESMTDKRQKGVKEALKKFFTDPRPAFFAKATNG